MAHISPWMRSTRPAASWAGKVEITEYDPQFDNAKFQEFARRLIDKDKVEVIFGAATSASREAIRPIIDKDNACYSTRSNTKAASATAT